MLAAYRVTLLRAYLALRSIYVSLYQARIISLLFWRSSLAQMISSLSTRTRARRTRCSRWREREDEEMMSVLYIHAHYARLFYLYINKQMK